MPRVELCSVLHLCLVETGDDFVDDGLQSLVCPEAEQRLRLVDLYVAGGAGLAGLHVADDARLADWGGRSQAWVLGGDYDVIMLRL